MDNRITAQRIKIIMNILDLKQVDVIEKCKPLCVKFGVKLNKNDLSQYVNGKVVPGDKKLDILSQALFVDKSWLLGNNGPNYGRRLKELREYYKYDIKTLSYRTGMPVKLIEAAETDIIQLSSTTLSILASEYNLSESEFYWKSLETVQNVNNSDILKYDNIKPVKLKKFPMLGEIACGEPIFADEDKEHCVMADMDIQADFCLTAKGDSMINARINNGDIVFIKEMPIVDNGEIAAVIIDNEATLKRVYYYREQNKLVLSPENPKYPPFIYEGEELNTIRILGKAVYFMSAL